MQMNDSINDHLCKMRRQIIAFCRNKEEHYTLQDMLNLLQEDKALITQHLTEEEADTRERKMQALICLLYFVAQREMEERVLHTREEEEEALLNHLLSEVDLTP